MKTNQSPATHFLSFDDQISSFELSPFEWSQNLCGIAIRNGKIILGLMKLPEESENDCFEWTKLKEVKTHQSLCTKISFSPQSSLLVLPKQVIFCASFSDFSLRIFNSDLDKSDSLRILNGHTSYINDTAWDTEGEFLASASDDHSLILWDCRDDFNVARKLTFDSPVMSCKFHADNTDKLLIGTKNGLIRYYNIKSDQIISSIETNIPLMSIDWAPSNPSIVAAITGSEISIWNLKKPGRPVEVKEIYESSGLVVKFSPANESLTASIGCPDWSLKVIHTKSPLPKLCVPLHLFGGLCWHHRLPYIAAAYDRNIGFWDVLSK